MTGSTHAHHHSASSPRPTKEGPARDNPIAGPRTGTTRSEPSAPALVGVSGRHDEPGSRPASACPAQPPSKAGGASPRGEERHHGVGKAKGSTESDQTGRGAAHHAGPPGTPERHASGHNQGTRTGAKQQRPPGAANPGSAHNTQGTMAQEQVSGNTKPTRHKPKPTVAGYKWSAHKHTHTPTTHPGVAGRSRNPSRSTHTHTTHTRREWRGTRRAPTQTHTHTPTPQPGVAGHSRNPSQSTHTQTAQPSQESRGTNGARTQAHTHPDTPARSGGAQPKPNPRTHTRIDNPSQEWRGTSRASTRAHTHPNTLAGRGTAQLKPEPKHTRPHRTPQRRVAGHKRSEHTNTRTPQHPRQEWRCAAEAGAQAHPTSPRTPARSGWAPTERAHEHTHTPTT